MGAGMDWLNKNWKKYLENSDEIIFHTVVDDVVIRIDSLLGAMFVGLFLGGWVFGAIFMSSGNLSMSVFIALIVFLMSCVLINMFVKMSFKAVHYVLTTKGVYKISGLIYKHVKFVPYNRITDAEMTCGLIGHICNTANIGICTASGTMQSYSRNSMIPRNEIDIKGIREYEKVRQLILGKIK